MLTWMESHPLPFACTTNFSERLDPATLRRFDFKVALDYLGPEQAIAAFRAFFTLPPPPDVATLSGLTPGDFAWCAARPRYSIAWGIRRPSPPCCARSAKPNRTAREKLVFGVGKRAPETL